MGWTRNSRPKRRRMSWVERAITKDQLKQKKEKEAKDEQVPRTNSKSKSEKTGD